MAVLIERPYDPQDISTRGPQVTARHGTKRWRLQVIKRIIFLELQRSSADRRAEREAHDLSLALGSIADLLLAAAPVAGHA